MPEPTASRLPILIGTAARAIVHPQRTDLIGLSAGPLFDYFPVSGGAVTVVVAVPNELLTVGCKHSFALVCPGKPKVRSELQYAITDIQTGNPLNNPHVRSLLERPAHSVGESNVTDIETVWIGPGLTSHSLCYLPFKQVFMLAPGFMELHWSDSHTSANLGNVFFGFAPPQAMSEEERMALRADPQMHSVIRLDYTCQDCGRSLRAYEAIRDFDPSANELTREAFRMREAPEQWSCECPDSQVTLAPMRLGWPSLFRRRHAADQETLNLTGLPEYRSYKVREMIKAYRSLLSNFEREEDLQKFLEDNAIFWHFLAPKRIIKKPRLLTDHVADFGILTSQSELVLVELEKPNTPLLTSSGAKSAKLQAGFAQIDAWREVLKTHRTAVLSCLEITDAEAASIRYLLVAGRDAKGASRVRPSLAHDTNFYTFDELGTYVTMLESQIARF